MNRFRYTKGNILLLGLVFAGVFMVIATALVENVTTYGRAERVIVAKAQALAIAEGAFDRAAYELNENPSYTGAEDVALGNGTYTIEVSNIDSQTKRIIATGYVPDSDSPLARRTVVATIGLTDDVVSFHYGIQAGDGGFSLANSSSITGNAFSTGPIIGSGGNMIYGDAVSAGASGWVYGVHATGTVFAHTIGKSGESTTVDEDAYYMTKVNTTVHGTSYPNSPDQPSAALPISDAQIGEWEAQAEAGGVIDTCDGSGNYNITSSMTLGPVKIACNLVVKSSSGILTVAGPIWVEGNITTQTGPTIRMHANLGSTNVAIIADNPANPNGSGKITVGQSTVFQGSGSPGSFVFLISQNRSAESGGTAVAIDMSQGASALVAYANHGLVTLSQSVSVKEATGYKIALSQSANVVYDSGLPSTVFESGPGGSWMFVPGTYAIAP